MNRIKNRLLSDLKSAMKNRQGNRVQALKLALSECKNQEIALKSDFNESLMIPLLQKQVKQYEESIDQYQKAGNNSAVQEQVERRDFIKSYLPAMLSDTELKKLIETAVKELNAVSIKDMGRVMQFAQAQAKGPVDKRLLAELVRERLKVL